MATDISLFITLVEQGSEHLAALCRLCEQEKSAIEQQDADALQQAVFDKQDALRALAANTDQRNQWLIEQGFSADQDGVSALIRSLPQAEGERLAASWRKLAATLNRAHELNKRNEQIVSRVQRNLEQLLGLLRGHTGTNTLYDQAGLRNYSARNTLGKA